MSGRLLNEEEQVPVETHNVLSEGKEYYRFAHHFTATLILVFLITWSLLPVNENEILVNVPESNYNRFMKKLIGVLPQRRWIIIGQALGLMGMLFAYVGLQFYDEDVLAVPIDDYRTLVDDRSHLITPPTRQEIINQYAFKETSGVIDIPIMDVCDILYAE
ncbi:similar to Saccharomyces cerevisiae YDR437W GPI19 Subunit of GPI-GlcNAc transferase involved in synthesis of N-acetylglucosaminyl phosphatidylinositol (GlcNAc-PI) [Maudiozyma barnettii]|uniref:Similar to Saccharomyces cerevisiae YDR437W GPI19 Subunit of GPI-GlcNAc transferase involved in synthesis of N-acetylglucosaminyl phosphatidylinositol (GlcNAc-PI) n=1 Tax=Maudiozyma barnettii TaxID=61262 RepID=A0A8H2VGZ4_9SACH|nr:phosphatidylinositol N-acetylglucosaminyltransferase GPI19 [Kazachstania barnettii]CAB4255073.1 similar to Saccharomyces cerevisiae YDR437W GPI19 Subunit of GPI-GlcNAc transferase involved in synthesis of N-acetylglucosaminyl phosphatidylinositol (GlcNAc-PI) [Kazachstania barnettii]CAD1783344.1 similar to Saccharomyces cerevisiae YDR437W GPI19 Subunit of GPI-GlcNAc transferase involved in synthesis of N-acetylglucosaminyl phosphatidylinositol (GlcNAc-PI) [Kazachstania barnettii]